MLLIPLRGRRFFFLLHSGCRREGGRIVELTSPPLALIQKECLLLNKENRLELHTFYPTNSKNLRQIRHPKGERQFFLDGHAPNSGFIYLCDGEAIKV